MDAAASPCLAFIISRLVFRSFLTKGIGVFSFNERCTAAFVVENLLEFFLVLLNRWGAQQETHMRLLEPG